MRTSKVWLLASVFCFASVTASAQQSTSAPPQAGPQTPQAASIIQQSIAAMAGSVTVTDVTQTGTVTFNTTMIASIPGVAIPTVPDMDSGTITLSATEAGQGKAAVTTNSGTRWEFRDISSGAPTFSEAGMDGVKYSVATQSMLSPHPAWFYPLLLLETALSSGNYASSYVGQESWNGLPVQHLSIWRIPTDSSEPPQAVKSATQHDLYFDSVSSLPVALSFAFHPYDPVNPNRPLLPYRGNSFDFTEQVTFSDYRQVEGRPVAFHIHTSIQSGPVSFQSDIQLSSVVFNSGLTITAN
jgi:hypothetical protein